MTEQRELSPAPPGCPWCDNTGTSHAGTVIEAVCGWCDGTGQANPSFHGWLDRNCGEHRTVGPIRAWCFDCGEWCYSHSRENGCHGCARTQTDGGDL